MKVITIYNSISEYAEISESGDLTQPNMFSLTVGHSAKTTNDEDEYIRMSLDRNQIKSLIKDLKYIIGE
jgi:hypothetical protein